MNTRIGLVLVLVALAGCAAPAPDAGTPPQPTTDVGTRTNVPATTVTQPPPTDRGISGSIVRTAVEGETIVVTVAVTNHGTNATRVPIAIRYVENDSFAKVGTLSIGPGQTVSRDVPLPVYGEDPGNLTVQLRIDGTVVAERTAN
ncbi:MAG: hypothetical protein ABEJ84_04315 [Halodesulfurarchaeum sp.]